MIPVSGTVIQAPVPQQRNMAKTFMITGIIHLIIAIFDIALGIVAITIWAWFSFYGIPIWAGVLFFGVTAVLGLRLSSNRSSNNNKLKIAFLVMSVLSACLAGSMVVVYGIAAYLDDAYQYTWCHPSRQHYSGWCPGTATTRIGINATLCFLAFFEMVIAIVSASAVCCSFSCCCPPTSQTNATTYVGQASTLSPGVVYTQGMAPQTAPNQYVVISPQQMAPPTVQIPQGQPAVMVAMPPPYPQGNPHQEQPSANLTKS